MHQINGRTHRTFEDACASQPMAERSTEQRDLERLGASVIPDHARATSIAFHGEWTIRSYGGRMFDAVIAGQPAITPAFDTLAELCDWLKAGE
jgi:hypothetical protein